MDKDAWAQRIKALEQRYGLVDLKLDQRSPTFQFARWRIAAEHQRQYRSVVLRWLGKGRPPVRPSNAAVVPASDAEKGWHFRCRVSPSELETLLRSLSGGFGNDATRPPATWLLTWNPARLPWTELPNALAEIRRHGSAEGRWNCGRATGLVIGDRVYLQRQGQEPRGICASGTVVAAPIEDEQWDPARAGTTHYVRVRWTAAVDPEVSPPFDPRRAKDPSFETVKWGVQGSGIRINPEAAAALALAWESHLSELQQVERLTPEQALRIEDYVEGALERVTVNRYERDPQARAACIRHYGAKCVVCDSDFAAIYGDIGRGFIEVHHLVAIASRKRQYVVNPVKDLRPVCPNCHRMLHAGSKPPSIDELRRVVEDRRRRRT